jgi:protein gp37
MRNPKYANIFELTIQKSALGLPLKWKKPQAIFFNSMSDLFHEDIEAAYIRLLQSLTKSSVCRSSLLTFAQPSQCSGVRKNNEADRRTTRVTSTDAPIRSVISHSFAALSRPPETSFQLM